jgi:hypothetical protein
VAARLRSLGSDARFLLLPEVGDDDDKRAPVVSGRERGRREWAAAAGLEGIGRGIEPKWLFSIFIPFLFPRLNMHMFKCYLNSNLNA